MRESLFKHTLVALGLLVAGICPLQAAKAQNPLAVEIGSGLQPGGIEDTVSPNKKKKRHEIQFSLSSADRQNGITGFVEDKTVGVRVTFESKRLGDQLFAQIENRDGFALIEYIEAQTELAPAEPGSQPASEWVPWLRVNGVEYKGYEGQVVDEMKAIASSEEAELIRYLAIYLVFHAPGEDLEPERRGLEVAYQSIQRFYEKGYRDGAPGELSRADLAASSQRRGARTATPKHEEPEGEFTLVPENCKMPDCAFVDTHDYQLTEKGGFTVKTLSVRLPLSHNYARPEMVHEEVEAADVRATDDGSQVGDCFGRCWAGCGDWTHEWISGPEIVVDYTYCEDVSSGYGDWGIALDCSQMCCAWEHRVVTEAGIAVHTAHGKVTLGAIAHDACCRNLFLGCLNPVCIALMIPATDCYSWRRVGANVELCWPARRGDRFHNGHLLCRHWPKQLAQLPVAAERSLDYNLGAHSDEPRAQKRRRL